MTMRSQAGRQRIVAQPPPAVRIGLHSRGRLCHRTQSRGRLCHGGFTLLEVLISSLLMTLVLGTLWEMFHVYSQLFERGGTEARHARLVTALQRQFADDLQRAIEDSPRPNDSTAGSSMRRFGLQGSSHALRFDVMQTLPDDQLPSSEDLPTLGRATTSKPQVPELKTVIYRFVSRRRRIAGAPEREATTEGREEPSAEASFARPGLTRWEIDFETPLEKNAAGGQPTTEATEDADVEPPAPAATGGTSFEDLVARASAPEAATWLPEVREATFRYFDGHAWSDSWNSLARLAAGGGRSEPAAPRPGRGEPPATAAGTVRRHAPTRDRFVRFFRFINRNGHRQRPTATAAG